MRKIYFMLLFATVLANSCSNSIEEKNQEDLFLNNSIKQYYMHFLKFMMHDKAKYEGVFKKSEKIKSKSIETITSVEQNKDNVNVLIHTYVNDLKAITKSQTFNESILNENLDKLEKNQLITKIKLIEYVALSELMFKDISENFYELDRLSIRTIPENIIVNKNQEEKIEIILEANSKTKKRKISIGEDYDEEKPYIMINKYDSIESLSPPFYLNLKTDKLGKQQAFIILETYHSNGSSVSFGKKIEYIVK